MERLKLRTAETDCSSCVLVSRDDALEYLIMESTVTGIEECQAQEISELMGVPFSTIDKHIRVLLERAYVERRGSKKNEG